MSLASLRSRQKLIEHLGREVGELVESHHPDAAGLPDFTEWADDPAGFIRDILKEADPGPLEPQVEIAEAVRDQPLVVVQSCNGFGKDWLAGRLALWWTYARRGQVLITGPTERQVREIVMRETALAWHRSGILPGDLYSLALRVGEEDQRGILAFTSSEASRLTGFHAPRMLVLMTEAQGCEDWAWEGLMACATGHEDRFLAVGNPLSPTGRFYQACRSGYWARIKLSAHDHPNVREGRVVVPGAVTRQFCDRIRQEYGDGSGTYRSRVLGEFPDENDEGLIRRSWLEAAADRHEDAAWMRKHGIGRPLLAVDPARYGPDSTAVARREGAAIVEILEWRGRDTMESAEAVAEYAATVEVFPERAVHPAAGRIVVDELGVGAGVLDRLRQTGFNAYGFNFGRRGGTKRFLNARAEAYWSLRKLLEEGKVALPRDEKLFDELVAIKWKPTLSGQIQIEAKDDLKSRLGRSPDRADAVVMALFAGSVRRATAIEWLV